MTRTSQQKQIAATRLKLVEETITQWRQKERERERVLVSKHSNRSMSYALSISCMASDTLGREGMAPFLVVVIAPQALENLSSSLSFFSSCNTTHESASFITVLMAGKLVWKKMKHGMLDLPAKPTGLRRTSPAVHRQRRRLRRWCLPAWRRRTRRCHGSPGFKKTDEFKSRPKYQTQF